MNPFDRLDYYKNIYTKNEVIIYEWIKKNPSLFTKYAIDDLTKLIPTSKAAIIRFSQKIGYSGFSEFKFELSRYLISGERKKNEDIEFNTIRSITSLYSGYIKQINDFVNIEDVKNIAKMMIQARKVKIVGMNRTGFSALQFRYRLTRINFDAEAITDSILFKQIEETLNEDDILIIFTTRGNNPYIDFIKNMQNNIKTVVISTANTPLLNLCSKSLLLPSIANASNASFLDDQALLFVFIEILLAEIAYIIEK